VTKAPVSTGDNDREDEESVQGHIDSMKTEMRKEKPWNTLLKQLIKFTYTIYRDSILGGVIVAAAFEKARYDKQFYIAFNRFKSGTRNDDDFGQSRC